MSKGVRPVDIRTLSVNELLSGEGDGARFSRNDLDAEIVTRLVEHSRLTRRRPAASILWWSSRKLDATPLAWYNIFTERKTMESKCPTSPSNCATWITPW